MTASGILPGDAGFTRGRGSLVTWVIRHATGASYSHTFVFHEVLSFDGRYETWETVEAWPSIHRDQAGPRFRASRVVDTSAAPHERRGLKIARLWRDATEQAAILDESARVANLHLPYGWNAIAGIVLGHDLPGGRGVICSEHVYAALTAARPELSAYLADVKGRVDPGQLSEACDALTADDRADAGAKAA